MIDAHDEIFRPIIAIAERHGGNLDKALEKFQKATLQVNVGLSVRMSYHEQVALLTLLNIGKRVFQGGVSLSLPDNVKNLTPHPGRLLTDLIEEEQYSTEVLDASFTVNIGVECRNEQSCQLICNDWQGGIRMPGENEIILPPSKGKFPFGAVAAASIACFEAFDQVYRMTDRIFPSGQGISLWNLNTENWYGHEHLGPDELDQAPNKLWFLGLGHLGQAYLWLLSFIEFPEKPEVLLQDFDIVTESNIGSQVLVNKEYVGQTKTRICSAFLESKGYSTRLSELPFEYLFQELETLKSFPILVNGLDNVKARHQLSVDRFNFILDGATNGQESLFDSFTLNVITEDSEEPTRMWASQKENQIKHPRIFDHIEKEGGCGAVMNQSISTPFVGCFGAAILMSELFKRVNNGSKSKYITVELRDLLNIGKY